jgi:hypothetical protein
MKNVVECPREFLAYFNPLEKVIIFRNSLFSRNFLDFIFFA